MSATRQHLAILLWAATPQHPSLCATPFMHAAVAAALDCEVEVHFSGEATRLLVVGVAEVLRTGGNEDKSIYAFMREAAAHGARFFGCRMGIEGYVGADEELIPEFSGYASATDFVMRSIEPAWTTLVY